MSSPRSTIPFLFGGLMLASACAPVPPSTALPADDDLLARIREASDGAPAYVDDAAGLVVVAGRVQPPSDVEADPVVRATWFLTEFGGDLDIVASELTARRIEGAEPGSGEEGDFLVVFEQAFDGVPVFGGQVRVEVDAAGAITAAVSNLPSQTAASTTPSVDGPTARTTVEAAHPGATVADSGLVILNPSMFRGEEGPSILSWRVEVDDGSSQPTRFVDATSGELLRFSIDGRVEARQRQTSTQSLSCGAMKTVTQVYDESGAIAGTVATADATAAHGFARTTWDYLWNTFSRDGHDGRGAPMVVVTDYRTGKDPAACETVANAFWLKGSQKLMFGEGTPSLDIFGHEYAHALIHGSAELVYADESGAMNESMADVFAQFIDNDNWTIGESSSLGILRDMHYPRVYNQPMHVDDRTRISYPSPSVDSCTMASDCGGSCTDDDGSCTRYPCTEFDCIAGQCMPAAGKCNDKGGVHRNSGIPNHAAYLINAGGTGPHGIAVSGIGQAKTEQIYFRALTWYMTSSSGFQGARMALRLAAWKFAQRGLHGVTYADCASVLNSFSAVGVGAIDTDRDCHDDDVDNCPVVFNPDQEAVGNCVEMCADEGSPCSGSGESFDGECCDGLICVVGACQQPGPRERTMCDDDPPCALGLACRPVGGDAATPTCCARSQDYCEAKEDCCGMMDCVGNVCVGRNPGEQCLLGDCAGGSFCDAGSCSATR